jgi:hypothetical protein
MTAICMVSLLLDQFDVSVTLPLEIAVSLDQILAFIVKFLTPFQTNVIMLRRINIRNPLKFTMTQFLSVSTSVQNGPGAYPASYPMGTRGSFPGDKAARGVELYLHSFDASSWRGS